MKFSIRYLLFATALLGLAFAILRSFGFLVLLATTILMWPSLVTFVVLALMAKTDYKINIILASSALVLVFALVAITFNSDSPYSFAIAIFSFFVITAAWLPQFLFFASEIDSLEARRRDLD